MSFTPAHIITSSQTGPHKNLETIVSKHLQSNNRKPIADHNRKAFGHAYQWYQNYSKHYPHIILDSGCGTGESSRWLAKTYPDHLVIGIDQSAKRLQHSDNQHLPDNCLLLRCECTDFWRLADQQQWFFDKHTLFYPNPYPKPQHIQRRWHGETAFINLINISREIELRTNWDIYAQEFYIALKWLKNTMSTINDEKCLLLFREQKTISLNQYQPDQAITAFERKYLLSQHTLWQVCAESYNDE